MSGSLPEPERFTRIQEISNAVQGKLRVFIPPGGELVGEKQQQGGRERMDGPQDHRCFLMNQLYTGGSGQWFPTSAALELGLILWGVEEERGTYRKGWEMRWEGLNRWNTDADEHGELNRATRREPTSSDYLYSTLQR